MKRLLFRFAALPLLAACACAAAPQPPPPLPTLIPKAAALPLALDDAIEFRKTKVFYADSRVWKPATNEMINFERARINYGAVSNQDRQQRYGFYYTFFWRTKRTADLTVRFEYRQQKLGSHVSAKEFTYNAVKGAVKTDFTVIGDEYNQDGRVIAWRALLIENGHIVALNQSFLWD